MNNEGKGTRNAVLIALCVVMAFLLAGLMYMSEQSDKARQTAVEDLQAQAKQYEEELAQIKSDLNAREKNITYVNDMAEAVVGFVISEEEDINYVKSAAESMDIQPVLVVDCSDELSDLKALVSFADNMDWEFEIMLTASSFSENVNDKIIEMLEYIESIGAKCADVFLLRNDEYTNKNIQTLIKAGFVGYTQYNQTSPASGMTDEGHIYFDYSYIQSMQTVVKERLKILCSNKASLIIVFDMAALREGTVTEEYVDELIEILKDYESEGACEITSVQDVVLKISAANKTEQERKAEYEEYAANQQERIDELEQTIREIYLQLG